LKLIEEWIKKPIGQIEARLTHEYKAQEEKKRRFEDAMFWWQFMVEQIFEEEGIVEKIRLCFSTNSRKVKEKLQQE